MIQQLLLPAKQIDEYWPGIKYLVPEGIYPEAKEAELLYDALKAERVAGVLIVQDEYLLGFLTLKFRETEQGTYLDIVTIKGIRMKAWWEETLIALEKIARGRNCIAIEFCTKRRAERFCTQQMGFKVAITTYRKVLK